jgi:hypothetical protein
MVEPQPSKLMTRVRFPSPAPVLPSTEAWRLQVQPAGLCRHRVDGPCGSVVEHPLGKGEVARSIRAMGTRD